MSGEGHDERLEQTVRPLVGAYVSRREFLKWAGIAGATVGVGGGLGGILAGCGSATSTTTAASQSVTTGAAGPAATTGAGGTIKIGHLTDYSVPPMINGRKVLEALVEGTNKVGGWDVGGVKYSLELTSYDTKSDPNTSLSAVQRLVTQDKVNVVFGDSTAGAWASVTEGAKTLALAETPLSDIFKPEYKYMFSTSKLPVEAPARVGYLPTYLGKAIKKFLLVFPDDVGGQIQSADLAKTLKALGQNFELVTYPVSSSDVTATSTKVLSANADALIFAGTIVVYAQLWRALKAAGYGGVVIRLSDIAPGELGALIPLTELDGAVGGIMNWDTDNPSAIGKEIVDFYTQKYGKWDDPGFMIDTFYAYKAALAKAGSVDGEKVAEALAAGLQFEGPHGQSKMIPRADAGVPDRAVCMIMQMDLMTMQGGKPTNIQSVPLADVEKYCLSTWGTQKQ